MMSYVNSCFVAARSRSKSMVQPTPVSEFDHDVRRKRVRSKSESVSDQRLVSVCSLCCYDNVTSSGARHLLTTTYYVVESEAPAFGT